MSLIGGRLAFDIVTAKFFLSLGGGPEQIGGEFCAAHMVENLLAFFETLCLMNCLGIQSAVEAHVSVVLENRIVDGFDDARIFGGIGELCVVLAQFLAKEETAVLFNFLIGQLLARGLDREIGLAEGNDFFARSAFSIMR